MMKKIEDDRAQWDKPSERRNIGDALRDEEYERMKRRGKNSNGIIQITIQMMAHLMFDLEKIEV